MLVVVGKIVGYLCPVAFLFCGYTVHVIAGGAVVFQPSAIPMYVQYHIHIVFIAIVYYFFYSFQPIGIYCPVGCVSVVPGAWYTHGVESGILYCIYQRLGYGRIAPCGLAAWTVKCIS